MRHLLIIELPGGNDADIVQAVLARGDRFSFASADLGHYRRQPALWARLQQAQALLDVPGLDDGALWQQLSALHAAQPLHGLLCLIETRLVEAARLAQRLGLAHVAPDTAALLRDKFSVRCRLREHGLRQPDFALATCNDEVQQAVAALGLPLLIKPADGYGSQNIVVLRDPIDLEPWLSPLDDLLPSGNDYGLGVRANDRLLVERYLRGRFVGCDVLSAGGRHRLLGVHEKLLFAPPSFAMRGSTFVPRSPAHAGIESYVFAALDAVGFDIGASHVELMLTDDGPQLVEINPRLVGAKMPRLVGAALGRSLHADLIDLHCGLGLPAGNAGAALFGALRWIVADRPGVLDAVELPPLDDPRLRHAEVLKRPGDRVREPLENADRIGYAMACAGQRAEAEAAAEGFVQATRVHLIAA